MRRTKGSPGQSIGQFILPISVTVDKNGFIYVMDVMTTRLTKFDQSGKPVIAYFGTVTATVGGLVRPKHVAVDDNGIIYVVDAAFQNVQLYDQNGQVLTYFGSPGNHPGAMYLPAGICVYNGDMDLFKDSGFAKVKVVTETVDVKDGKLDITFTPNVENPEINAIEIIPA